MAELAVELRDDEELIEKYHKILRANGIKEEIAELELKVATELHGEHFGSCCEYLTIQFRPDKNSNIRSPLDLFVKRITTNEDHAKFIRDFKLFEKESAFFNTFVGELKNLSLDSLGNTEPIDTFPKCFYATDETIVLENISKQGFVLIDKFTKMNFDQTKYTLIGLARYHALSYALINGLSELEIGEKYPYLEEVLCIPEQENGFGKLIDPVINLTIQILKLAENNEGASAAYESLAKFEDKAFQKLIEIYRDEKHIFKIVQLGDCWINNLMLKLNDESGKPEDLRFFDFQCASLGSPSIEVGYFLFTSAKTLVWKQWKVLLEIYWNEFLKNIQKYKNIDFNYKFEEFLEDFKIHSLKGFFLGMLGKIGFNGVADMDVENMEGSNLFEEMNKKIKVWLDANPEKSKEIVRDVIEFIQEYDNILMT